MGEMALWELVLDYLVQRQNSVVAEPWGEDRGRVEALLVKLNVECSGALIGGRAA